MSESYEREFIICTRAVLHVPVRKPLAPCWPAFGSGYKPGESLLVVGRATNGFEKGFLSTPELSEEGVLQVVREARDFAETTALSWIDNPAGDRGGTTGSRSPFWRVTRGFLRGSGLPLLGPWYAGIGWSNLAKFAPADRGNPSTRLWRVQRGAAARLLRMEVEEAAPTVVLVLAGAYWETPLLETFEDCIAETDQQTIRHVARTDKTLWLFAGRPEGKPEAPFVKSMIGALERARRT